MEIEDKIVLLIVILTFILISLKLTVLVILPWWLVTGLVWMSFIICLLVIIIIGIINFFNRGEKLK